MAELVSYLSIVPHMRSFDVLPKYSAPFTRVFLRGSTSCAESRPLARVSCSCRSAFSGWPLRRRSRANCRCRADVTREVGSALCFLLISAAWLASGGSVQHPIRKKNEGSGEIGRAHV